MRFLIFLFPIISFAAPIDESVSQLEAMTGCKLVVTSGHRTPEHNKKIGGAKNSLHLYNRARDIVPTNNCISLSDLADEAHKLGLTTIEYQKHIHIDNRDKPKQMLKVKTGFVFKENRNGTY